MIKVYTLKRMRAAVLTVTDGTNTIRATFQPSYGTVGHNNGRIIVADVNFQRIFEADKKFGKTYYLSDQWEDAKEAKKSIEPQDAHLVYTPMYKEKRLRTQAEIDAEKAKPKKAVKKDEAKAVAFDNKNDVIAYLTEQGEKFATEDELADLMRKYNIKLAE